MAYPGFDSHRLHIPKLTTTQFCATRVRILNNSESVSREPRVFLWSAPKIVTVRCGILDMNFRMHHFREKKSDRLHFATRCSTNNSLKVTYILENMIYLYNRFSVIHGTGNSLNQTGFINGLSLKNSFNKLLCIS